MTRIQNNAKQELEELKHWRNIYKKYGLDRT